MKKLAEYFSESEQGSIRPQVGDTFDIVVNEELAIEAGVLESTEDKLVLEYDERGISLLDSLGLTEGFDPESFEGYVENFEFTGDDGETQMGTLYFTANVEDGQVVVDPKSLRGESEPNYIAKVDDNMATMNVQQGGVDYEAAIEDAQEEAEVIWSMRDNKYAHGESVEHIDEEELDEMGCGSKRKKYEDVELEENPIKKALGKLIKPHTKPTPTQDEKNDNPLKRFKDIFDRASTMPGIQKEVNEGKSSTGYELYHKDFTTAMQHAYDFAKKKFGITVDPDEIDSKVAMGPRKPSKGKTNSYRLKGDKGTIQVQVYGMDDGKYELNMYKEDVELDEAEYQGRKVKLGKPMRGDVAKYKVYVKDPKTGNVKKVNFGDKKMEIKRDNPKRRKNFRARHNCANPGPRTKARYWSCRMWSSKPVSKIV